MPFPRLPVPVAFPDPPGSANEAQAGMAWRDMAKDAYLAYRAYAGAGGGMVEFEALSHTARSAWEAAVRHVGDLLDWQGGARMNRPKPERWAGWTPPGE